MISQMTAKEIVPFLLLFGRRRFVRSDLSVPSSRTPTRRSFDRLREVVEAVLLQSLRKDFAGVARGFREGGLGFVDVRGELGLESGVDGAFECGLNDVSSERSAGREEGEIGAYSLIVREACESAAPRNPHPLPSADTGSSRRSSNLGSALLLVALLGL